MTGADRANVSGTAFISLLQKNCIKQALPFNAPVSALGRFLRPAASAISAEPVREVSGWLRRVSGDCAAVGVASAGTAEHLAVGSGLDTGMSGRAPDAVVVVTAVGGGVC